MNKGNQKSYSGITYDCEVWEKDYPHGAPMRWVGSFDRLFDAQQFINMHPNPEYYCIRSINDIISERSFTG